MSILTNYMMYAYSTDSPPDIILTALLYCNFYYLFIYYYLFLVKWSTRDDTLFRYCRLYIPSLNIIVEINRPRP
jgi:hypothetical protein